MEEGDSTMGSFYGNGIEDPRYQKLRINKLRQHSKRLSSNNSLSDCNVEN
jgi:hypothetical protein